jgi:hypothetical protein
MVDETQVAGAVLRSPGGPARRGTVPGEGRQALSRRSFRVTGT